jgi:hydroxymethylglutaryl-CoA reductase
MIGGTSRGVVEEVVEVAGVERGCDIVAEEGEVDAVTEDDEVTSD